jgi:hypothetical protein
MNMNRGVVQYEHKAYENKPDENRQNMKNSLQSEDNN